MTILIVLQNYSISNFVLPSLRWGSAHRNHNCFVFAAGCEVPAVDAARQKPQLKNHVPQKTIPEIGEETQLSEQLNTLQLDLWRSRFHHTATLRPLSEVVTDGILTL